MEVKVTIPKRRKLFETFITIGICPDYLDSIDLNTLLLTPKLTYSYPDNQTSNYEYYKNFCYKDGVNVIRMELTSESEYAVNILESNFFSKPISTFAFMKPSLDKAPDKYIYGMKFHDIFIFKPKKNVKQNSINVFQYEKCYLFISNEPYFQTLEIMCKEFLNIKKLNYLNNLTSFTCFFEQGKLDKFHYFNNESNNETINTIIQKVHKTTYQTSLKYLNELSPNLIDKECYLSWLLRKVISHYDSSTFFRIMVMVLLEQQVLFYGNNLELITFSSLLFSSIISPFKWKYPLIPNLPLDQIQMLSSPVPYIAGIQAEEKDLSEITYTNTTNLIKVEDNNIEIKISLNNDYNYKDCLYYLNGLIDRSFWKVESEHFKKNEKITKKYCEEIREDILKGINTSIIDKMKTHIISKNNGEEFEIEKIKKVIKKEIISQWDSKFFSDFCETEMFICLYETLLNN